MFNASTRIIQDQIKPTANSCEKAPESSLQNDSSPSLEKYKYKLAEIDPQTAESIAEIVIKSPYLLNEVLGSKHYSTLLFNNTNCKQHLINMAESAVTSAHTILNNLTCSNRLNGNDQTAIILSHKDHIGGFELAKMALIINDGTPAQTLSVSEENRKTILKAYYDYCQPSRVYLLLRFHHGVLEEIKKEMEKETAEAKNNSDASTATSTTPSHQRWR